MLVVWLEQAEFDLDHHIRFIASQNPRAALDQDLLIQGAIERLSLYPNIGKIGRLRSTRELVISHTSFIAVYRVQTDRNQVHILRILHTSQKWPPE